MKKILLNLFITISLTFLLSGHILAIEPPTLPQIYIRAVNPGYTVDGKSNVGEFIELARADASTPLSLAGLVLGYTNSSGKTLTLLEFPENSWMTGERILLRLASSSADELADILYSKTLAMKAGPLELTLNGEVIDTLCWTGKAGCMAEFKSDAPTTLVRDGETFIHSTDYLPSYDPESPGYYEEKPLDETPTPQCQNLRFSEILSYYESDKSEQFIEFYNPTSEQILLDGCQIKYKNKYYPLAGIVRADDYASYFPRDFALTKNPTTSNTVELIDTDGSVVDTLVFEHGQKKATSYAWLGYDQNGEEFWHYTYSPTPGTANNYQEFKTCEAGKVINEDTGNCVKPAQITEVVCGEGKYLNPATGRCKSYVTEIEKVCDEGYELNPDTNRCRKIKTNTGADYELSEAEYNQKTSFVALYAIIGLAALSLFYIIFQFRHEIKKFFDRVFRRAR